MADLQEAFWELSHIDQSSFKIFSQIWIVLVLKSLNDELDDSRLIILIKLFHNLLLSIKMDRATHDDERSV